MLRIRKKEIDTLESALTPQLDDILISYSVHCLLLVNDITYSEYFLLPTMEHGTFPFTHTYPVLGWFLTAAITLVYLYFTRNKSAITHDFPPDAPGGYMYISARVRSIDLHNYVLEVSRTVGKVVRLPLIPFLHIFMVADAKIARMVLENSQTRKWGFGYGFIDHVCGGDNFFSSEGKRHGHVRKSTSTAFAKQHVEDMMRTAEVVLEEWLEQQSNDFELDISREMQKLTIQVIGKIGFNFEFSMHETLKVQESLQIAIAEFSQNQRRYPQRKLFGYFYPGVRRAWQASRDLNDICRTILQAYKEGSAPNSLLMHIVNDKDYDNDEQRIRDMILYLAAGYDTTASTISWTLLELAKNPPLQNWLREELLKLPSVDRRHATALKHVIKESMRLHITSPVGALRRLSEDLILEDGTLLPAKAVLIIATYAIHRDESVFEKADAFVPRRWEDATPEMQKSWIGFSLGRRSCLGQALAKAELSVVLAKLCCNYEWSVIEEGRGETSVTLKPVGAILKAKKV